MHHHFSTYYEIDRKMREQEVQRKLEHECLVQHARANKPHRIRRWRTILATFAGFFF